jgi:hypothetical protein
LLPIVKSLGCVLVLMAEWWKLRIQNSLKVLKVKKIGSGFHAVKKITGHLRVEKSNGPDSS